jgi:BlaI family transcriptional regulator, penicillinase repressor
MTKSNRKQLPKPTSKELEILQIIWKNGPSSVRDLQEALGGDASNGYTTILKLMQIMNEKGLLTRQKSGKLHLYKAVATEENTNQQLVDRMIETVFQGSATQLVLRALGNAKSSPEDLLEIRHYLDQLEKGQK